jgi:hypothetical protein
MASPISKRFGLIFFIRNLTAIIEMKAVILWNFSFSVEILEQIFDSKQVLEVLARISAKTGLRLTAFSAPLPV